MPAEHPETTPAPVLRVSPRPGPDRFSLVGMITANLASLFIEPDATADARSLDERLAATEDKLDAVARRLDV